MCSYRPPQAFKRYTFTIPAGTYTPTSTLGSITLPANSLIVAIGCNYTGSWSYSNCHIVLSDDTDINLNVFPPTNNKTWGLGAPATGAIDVWRVDKAHKRFYVKNESGVNNEVLGTAATVTLIVLAVI